MYHREVSCCREENSLERLPESEDFLASLQPSNTHKSHTGPVTKDGWQTHRTLSTESEANELDSVPEIATALQFLTTADCCQLGSELRLNSLTESIKRKVILTFLEGQ